MRRPAKSSHKRFNKRAELTHRDNVRGGAQRGGIRK